MKADTGGCIQLMQQDSAMYGILAFDEVKEGVPPLHVLELHKKQTKVCQN